MYIGKGGVLMVRTVGTTARGIITPIIQKGDDLPVLVVDSILKAAENEGFQIRDRDVVGITESVLARAQGNYAGVDDIRKDIEEKFTEDFAIVFPILSRNRFAVLLEGIMAAGRKVYLLLSYPSDEVGNHLMSVDQMDQAQINPYTDTLDEGKYRQLFGDQVAHPFTGIDYVELYKKIGGDNLEIIFSNDPRTVLDYTKNVLVANVHDRFRTRRILEEAGAELIYGLDDILASPNEERGYNPEYGLLGSNLSKDDEVKLFPRDSQPFVEEVQKIFKERTGKIVEVLVFGDGAFRDPVGKIWELADPVVSPGYTKGLEGTPSEIKLKYVVEAEFDHLTGQDVIEAAKKKILSKDERTLKSSASLGTTPRQLTDLLGSLCDLTTGSGDKGTPVVLIQGYFDNYASNGK